MFIIYYGFDTWALCDKEGDIVSCHANEYEAENAQIVLGGILNISCKVSYR